MVTRRETVHQRNYRDGVHMGTSLIEAAVFRPEGAPAYIRRKGGHWPLVSDNPPTVEYRYFTVPMVPLGDAIRDGWVSAISRVAAMQTGESS